MRIIAVDDELLMLDKLCACILEAAPNAELSRFQSSSAALEFAMTHQVDVAFLDIQMRGMDGIELGRQLKLQQPRVNIIFCTGYSDHIFDAVRKIRCSGYLMKPVTTQDIVIELENLRVPIQDRTIKNQGIYIQCFGNFEVFCDGKLLEFNTAKTKELLAYLVDRRGTICQNAQIMATLWDDDKNHTAYLKKCRKDLFDTLKNVDCENIIIKQWGGMAIDKNMINCDYYEWWNGDADGIKAFSGQYMEQYSWAEVTRATLLNVQTH